MADSKKRASMRWAGLAALAATAGLIGCGKKDVTRRGAHRRSASRSECAGDATGNPSR